MSLPKDVLMANETGLGLEIEDTVGKQVSATPSTPRVPPREPSFHHVVDQQSIHKDVLLDTKRSAVSLIIGGEKGEEVHDNIYENWRIPLLVGPIVGVGIYAILFFVRPPGLGDAAMRIIMVAVTMAIWWMAEALPLGIVSLLPLCCYPLLEIMPSKEVAPLYASSTFWLFFGGIQLSFAIERSGLHRRIALAIIRAMGTRIAFLMLGMNAACAALSLFLSNTSTTVMLLPVAKTLVTTLEAGGTLGIDLKIPFMLGLAYSASGGGVGTLIGTGTNVAFAAIVTDFDRTVSFAQWMIFALPLAIFMVIFIWVYFVVVFKVPFTNLPPEHPVLTQLKDIHPMTQAECVVSLIFLMTVVAWMSRDYVVEPLGMKGFLTDDVIAIVMTISLFIIKADYGAGEGKQPLMDWKTFLKMPWELMFLFGGGLSLASGFSKTGLSAWLGAQLAVLDVLPKPLLVGSVIAAVTFLTEVTSNVATANVWLPIMGQLSIAIGENPLYLMIPTTLAASCAFMLPVATPPNAVIFGSGFVTIRIMAKNGFIINCCAIVIITTYCILRGTDIGTVCEDSCGDGNGGGH